MANTYTQIYIQIVFAVQGRQNLIGLERKEELHRYITGIITRQGQKLLAIHCMPDHTHILIGLKPNMSLSDLVGDIKTGSTNHINENRWVKGRFSWQEGFGAFSYSHSQLTDVILYIQNQVEHHTRKGFREEYLEFLERFQVPYEERYLVRTARMKLNRTMPPRRGLESVGNVMAINMSRRWRFRTTAAPMPDA